MDLEDLEIIVGTYEEFLLGYQVLRQENEEYDLAQSFATHSHRASVRSVAAGGKFVASGGTDESIFLYDMSTRKEVGLLMQHHGTISCLEFAPNGTHLLSGSEDGSIGASRTGNWQLEKLWGKAHKGCAVSSVSIHPSGKLFLSVGVDGTVRTWNFVKGRPAYTTHLCKLKDGRSVTQVMWSPNGETYSVLIGNRVEVFSVTAASIVHTIQLDTKITCISYLNSDVLCVASEDGRVLLYNIQEQKRIGEFQAHEGRVRCLMSFKLKYVISASSTGQIKLWCIKDPNDVLELCEISTGCRITCMTLVNVQSSSENTRIRLLKQLNLSGMKLELDAECAVKSKRRAKHPGVVTVEVDEPKIEDNETSQDGTTVKSNSTDPTLTNNRNEKHKKKKKKQGRLTTPLNGEEPVDESEVQSKHTPINRRIKKKKQGRLTKPLNGEDFVDESEVQSKHTPTNKRIKKKKSQIEEVQNETIPNERNARRSLKRQASEEAGLMFVDQDRKHRPNKLRRTDDSHGVIPTIKDKNSKKKRKEQVWEETVVMSTTNHQSGEKHLGKNKLKKSKKQKTVSSCDVIDSPEAVVMLTTNHQSGKRHSGKKKLMKSKKQKSVSSSGAIDSPSGKWIAE